MSDSYLDFNMFSILEGNHSLLHREGWGESLQSSSSFPFVSGQFLHRNTNAKAQMAA